AKACAAGSSSPRYASNSTILPDSSSWPSRRTNTLPSSAPATSRGSRLKNRRETGLSRRDLRDFLAGGFPIYLPIARVAEGNASCPEPFFCIEEQSINQN